jgi:SAM-dependent methyltransferase
MESVPAEVAERLFHREAFRKPPQTEALEPFTRDWFERIGAQRYARHGYWMPRVLEFARHRGDTVLCLGEGLGTDWVQYARHGAEVITLCASHEQLDLIRTHFEHCNQFARFLHGSPQKLPLPSDSVDVACVQGLLHEIDDPAPVVDEVFRVLRPGGKVIAVAPAKFNANFWYNASYPWRHWFGFPRGERLQAPPPPRRNAAPLALAAPTRHGTTGGQPARAQSFQTAIRCGPRFPSGVSTTTGCERLTVSRVCPALPRHPRNR